MLGVLHLCGSYGAGVQYCVYPLRTPTGSEDAAVSSPVRRPCCNGECATRVTPRSLQACNVPSFSTPLSNTLYFTWQEARNVGGHRRNVHFTGLQCPGYEGETPSHKMSQATVRQEVCPPDCWQGGCLWQASGCETVAAEGSCSCTLLLPLSGPSPQLRFM